MKTPEEWNWEYSKICAADPAVHGQLLPTPQNVEFIRRVQFEAYHEGQLAGLKLGNETAMKTIDEVFSKPAERSESV